MLKIRNWGVSVMPRTGFLLFKLTIEFFCHFATLILFLVNYN